MPAHRLPVTKAKALGADIKDPARHASRATHKVSAIGDPFVHMTDNQQSAWYAFVSEIPWLDKSHRALLEVVCTVRARLIAGEDVGVTSLNMYQSCLSKMGATPADASRVPSGDDGEDDDPVFS